MLQGGFERDCDEAGIAPFYRRVADMASAVTCDYDGSENPLGLFWRPDLRGGVPVKVCNVSSSNGLSDSSFRDADNLGPASGTAQNEYRGFVRLEVDSDAPFALNLWRSSGIRFNNPQTGQCVGGSMRSSFAVGDTVWIVTTMTDDGTHPSSIGAAEMARRFDLSLVLAG
jgi:hypothetical protein